MSTALAAAKGTGLAGGTALGAMATLAAPTRKGEVVEPKPARLRPALNSRQKAAVIVRLLLSEGTPIPLAALPEHLQAALTEQMGHMRLVDRITLREVVQEFLTELEGVGLAFPGGIDGALSLLDGHISATAANRLRRLAGASGKADPWDRIVTMDLDRLMPVLEEESVEVGAVMLSKLPVDKAAELLGRLPGDKARRVAYAVSLTGNVDPETVRRIGLSLGSQLESVPPRAFESNPVDRVGAILNATAALIRDDVLAGLLEADEDFAERVRKTIFTFVHIPARIAPADVPKVVRRMEQRQLVAAIGPGDEAETRAAEFILENLSQRMADSLREELAEAGAIRASEVEAARAAMVQAIRELQAEGELAFVEPEDD